MLSVRWYLQRLMLCLCYACSSLVVTKPYAMGMQCFGFAGSRAMRWFAGIYKALCYAYAILLVRWYLQSLMLCLCSALSSLVFTKPHAMPMLCFQFAGIYKALCFAYAMLLVRWHFQRLMLCLCYAFRSLVMTEPYAMRMLCVEFAGMLAMRWFAGTYKALCYAYAML